MTLLDKARKVQREKTRQHSSTVTRDQCELALAWMKREISTEQVQAVVGCRYDGVHHRMAAIFLAGLRAGLIEANLRNGAKRGGGAGV